MPTKGETGSVRVAPLLQLKTLGTTPQAATRRLLTEFRRRGWQDPGASAVAIVRALEETRGGITPRRAAALIGQDFLAVNGLKRSDVEYLLSGLASGT